MTRNGRDADTAVERLSSGNKINSAADDAAGLAIANRMTAQIRGLGVAIQNAHDALNMVSTADGAASAISDILQKMRELALQAASGTTDAKDRTYLNTQYEALKSEIRAIAHHTAWNGKSGGSVERPRYEFITQINSDYGAADYSGYQFVIGTKPSQTVDIHFGDFTVHGGGGRMKGVFSTSDYANRFGYSRINNGTNASAAITAIDTAFDKLSTKRAEFGGATNRLTYAVDNLSNVLVNAKAARGRVLDADYAVTTSKLAKAQILQEASMAMISQANALPETVMMLLRD